ncbi:alpha/beta fold hydrolase [Mycobacterium yunnanensis]|uniref:Alpha/beta fold hydrolase n=1 Tax=Mycobacterium yunnanensis TaxID=368477 RepID=A0A9X2Z636_9MYCO|nr:alpha/beta fold hydrolase [Mycobacterium yunnanensis]MCV7422906.1 alpha/beta fold hydrolase [Mycobacterium yunnanensis]
MHEGSRHRSSHGASAPDPRFRLALAALLLGGFSAGALGTGGVALADDDGTSSSSGATSSQSSQHDTKPDKTGPDKTGPDETGPEKSKPDDTKPKPDKTEPDENEPDKPKPDTAEPDDTAPDAPRHSNEHALQANTVAPASPTRTPPKPTAAKTTTQKTSEPSAPEPPARALQVVAAAVAPTAPVAPEPAPTIAPRLDRQLAGLAVDVATVTVSAVHTAATVVAHAFGPSSFLGVPYLLAVSVANAAAAVGRTLVGASPTPPTGRFAVDYGILDGLAFFTPTRPPAGANDSSITVTPEHPLPVILLNGTVGTQGVNWSVGAPVLANAGYKVYSFNYGNITADPNFPVQSLGDIRQSGRELAAEVDRVLAETGAPKVILVGHSQGGGILPVYYVNELGGAAKVSQIIGLAPSNHGTDFNQLNGLTSIPILGALFTAVTNAIAPALLQQAVGSPFQQEVYGDGDTRPGVLYTTIASVNDEVVTPYTQQALHGPGVTNVVLQDRYPGLVVGHANIFLSPQVMEAVLDALAANPAANPLPYATVAA